VPLLQRARSECGKPTCPACAEPLNSKETTAAVPSPALGKRSAPPNRKRSELKIFCLLTSAVLSLAFCVHLAIGYREFTEALSAVNGVRIGDHRSEVKYRLGMPQSVIDSFGTANSTLGEWVMVYSVNARTSAGRKLPPNTDVEDYDQWVYEIPVYEEAATNDSITIEFSESDRVNSLGLFSGTENSFGWGGSVGGIFNGTPEGKVLQLLGAPSRQTLKDVTKKIEYDDLGLVISLTKGKAYRVQLTGVPQSSPLVFWRYLRQQFL